MSCENYCPEVHNASESEDSDYEVKSLTSEEDGEDLLENTAEKINNMIKEEVKKVIGEEGSFLKSKDFKKLNEMTEEEKSKLSDLEKINLVGKTIWRSGGISVDNIIELKQILFLVSATSQMEDFKDFPRDHCLKCLEMIIYHANKHLESLDI
jgi:hypothetical protein